MIKILFGKVNPMSLISTLIDFILHMDKYLPMIIQALGIWTYAALFFVIFMETGFVVTPFLPGDSLLFAAGAIAALPGSGLNIFVFYILMAVAAVLGDTVNYWIGHYVGPRAFSGNIRWLKKEYLDRTQKFYEKHGGKTILLARFVPIIRTFAPFVAGVGQMRYGYFISYNVFGGILWTALFTFGGYFVGNLEIVQKNFSLIVVMIVLISTVPAFYEFFKARSEAAAEKKAAASE
jgi:membrane-associated protein